jgi:DHA2 family multidrug resistance protein
MTTTNIIIIITSILAALLEIIDTSIVNVAVPTMMGNLGVTLDEISWVSTAYMIANSIVLPIAAWFGSRLGRKRYFTGAIAVFTLASLACGLAPNLPLLVIFRLIQGFAGGALLPTSQMLIQEQFPKEKATLAMGIFGMSVMIGPALGPVLGGYLTDNFGWRSIFNVNVPLGIIAGILSYMYIGAPKHETDPSAIPSKAKGTVDWTGFALLSLGVGCFQYILERGQTDGWFDSKSITVVAALAFLGTAAFIWWELRVDNPIMNLRLFKSRVVSSGAALMLAFGIVVYALTFVVPVFVDNVVHMTATQTGLLFIPGSLATSFAMGMVDPLSKKLHPRALLTLGVGFSAISVLMMTHFTTATGGDDLFWPLIVRGVGLALLFVPIVTVVNYPFQGEELEQVSGMMNFFRQIGGSIGIASLSTLLTRFGKQNYLDLMPKMSVLSQGGYQAYGQIATGATHANLSTNIGMGLPQTLGIKALWARTMGQSFIMSFDQLCWVIILITVAMLIPTFIMQMPRRMSANLNAH